MNRNLQGEWFSRDELMDMAVEIGAVNRDTFDRQTKTWVLLSLTREHRFGMFMRGEAILDTRSEPNKATPAPVLDWELLAFLGVTA